MTGENREKNSAGEVERAEECLREARALEQGALPYGAISRAYYAVFHGAQALLLSIGLEPRTHRGVVTLVGTHFVKTGILPPEMGRLVSHIQRDREDADYDPGAIFTSTQAREAVEEAERFLGEVRRLLSAARSR